MRLIYDSHSQFLAAVCSRFITDRDELKDVMQEAFVRIFTSLDKFSYRGEGSLRAWMRQVAVNEALKLLRSKRRKNKVDYVDELPETPECDEGDVELVPPKELQRMLKELPEHYRTVFNLFVFEEKSHREIASLTGITENNSATLVHRAKALLARKIRDYIERTGKKDGE